MVECFTILSNEIEGRIDSEFYHPKNKVLLKELECSGYKIIRLGDISEIIRITGFETTKFVKYVDKGVYFLRVHNILQNKISLEDVNYISEEAYGNLKRYELLPGDVALTNTGRVGTAAIIPKEVGRAIGSQEILRIRLKSHEIHSSYLSIFLNSTIGERLIKRWQSGTSRPRSLIRNIRNIPIVIPPLNIQEKIIRKMESSNNLKISKETESEKLINSVNNFVLEELDIKISKLENKRIYVINFNDLLNKRIDAFYYQPKFDEIEKAIKKGKFGIVEIGSTLEINSKLENINQYENINYVDLSSIKKDSGIIEDVSLINSKDAPSRARQKLERGDLLLAGLSGSLKSIAVFEKDGENFIGSTGFYIIKKSSEYNNYYLFALFRSTIYQLLLNRETTGAIMSSVSREALLNIKIPFPSISVQNKIAEEVKNRMRRAEQLQKEAKEELEKAKQEIDKIILKKDGKTTT